MLENLVTIIHVTVAFFMILVVLVQGGNQGGVGAAFGGGNTQGVFGASGATSFLGKLTYGAALIFMVTSISLAVIQGGGGTVGLSEKLKAESAASQPAATETAKPAAEAEKAKPAKAEPKTEATEATETKAPKPATETK